MSVRVVEGDMQINLPVGETFDVLAADGTVVFRRTNVDDTAATSTLEYAVDRTATSAIGSGTPWFSGTTARQRVGGG